MELYIYFLKSVAVNVHCPVVFITVSSGSSLV